MKVAQSCLTLWNPMDYTVHGILQARMLEWVAFPFSRGSSQLRDRTQVSHIAGRFFTSWSTREALVDNPPASAGGTGSVPDGGWFHIPRSSWTHSLQLLSPRASKLQAVSLCAATTEPCTQSLCSVKLEKPFKQIQGNYTPISTITRNVSKSNFLWWKDYAAF